MIVAYTNVPDVVSRSWLLQLQHLVPGSFLQTINVNKKVDGLARSLAGRYLLSEILKSENQPTDVSLLLDAYKRPYLEGSPWRFSISHSNNAVVCVCSKENEVGIDIEKITPIDTDPFKILFTDEQFQEVTDPEAYPFAFYNLWTAKEAISKAIGRGLHIDFKNLTFVDNGDCVFDNHHWYTTKLSITPGYCCTLASEKPLAGFSLREYKIPLFV